MRVFRVDDEPTASQLAEIQSQVHVLPVRLGGYYLTVEDDGEDLPSWLPPTKLVNVPGEIHRCTNCGEPV
jgi:hypothetical protein